ncbi:positive transcriptional regulator MutR family [Streptococcus pneumoniae]|nr:Rgg/GadR/MutR family transcriptional regulator [Streptococcus pneumoniae]AWW22521.1 positive transcriptional regulatorMutRfamily [Streptococcus pneumoniae]AWW22594.1 positive transcriptional regulator MutRfamily [Streptococcus pneumoniae]AWW22669.1 positive transcriptional regulator MutRfamily [Streptococcus pneumoniae]AWW22928.1 positive transcriptional regulator MutRfamily [Streptococcus pneumoniae]KXT24001.1 MutR family transcriptional regulator [Streptococcus pneumoniae]
MKYGKIFKKFRESRGLSLKDVAKSGLSSSHLSRFEHDEADLTISKFLLALDAIHMPIEEFVYAVRDFRRDDFNELLEKIRYLVSKCDIDGMKKLLISQIEKKDKKEPFDSFNTILLKIRLQDLLEEILVTDQEIGIISDYLFSVEYWGYYELLLFMNTIDVLNHKTMMVLAKEMCHRSEFYREIPNNRRLLATMLLNAYITCIERNELMDALYFEKQLKYCNFSETEMYEKLVLHYTKNLYDLKKNNNRYAVLEMRKCIATMKLVDSNQTALKFENHLQKVLGDLA